MLTAILTLAAPGLAAAAGAGPVPVAPPAQGEVRPAIPPAIAAPPPEMHAYLKRDGRETEVSLFSDNAATTPVATVDDEPISLLQLAKALNMAHRQRREGDAKQHDFRPVLERLVDLKLCALEAKEMGLDELPDVKKAIEREEGSELIERVRAHAIQGVKPTPAEVDRVYRDAVREWKLRSLLFEREESAKTFQKASRGGKDFEAVAKKLIADGKAKGTVEAEYSSAGALLPQVHAFVSKAKMGQSKVLRVKQGWSFVQVLGTRYPENPEAHAAAEQKALAIAQQTAANKLYDSLEKKYARIDRKLFKSIDFEKPKPGFAAYQKDNRPLATIAGEKPFTVADLADAVAMKFFHGMDAPIKEHRANSAKFEAFQTMLRRRLVLQEAKRLGIAQSEDYRRHMADFREATLFAAYVERSIMPDVKVTEAEGQDYYAKHKSEFTTPAVYKLDSVAFTSAKDAQSALEKLRGGTDFKWLRANANGQVKDSDRALQLDGSVLSVNALDPDLRQQLAGTKPGDYRLSQVQGQYYVVRVVNATLPDVQRYQDARETIGKKLIGENLQKAMTDATAKLRKTHKVAVYLTKIGY
jgi:hypothetical protein